MNEAELAAGLPATSSYRYADVVGDRMYVAGQMPAAADRTLVAPGDAAAQAARCLVNLRTLLGVHGFTEADVRHLRVYVVGPADHMRAAWAAVVAHFDGNVPPATLLGVTLLGWDGQLVEVDAVIERVAPS